MTAGPDTPIHIVLVLVPRFTLSALALAVDVLRVANREALRPVFTWDIVTPQGVAGMPSSGLPVAPTRRMQDILHAPIALVFAAWEPEAGVTPALLAWLHGQNRKQAVLGAVENGAFILAQAGLLQQGEAALHIESRAAFAERFDEALLSEDLWTLGERRMSCSGVISLLDMLLALIARECGPELARNVADIFAYRPPPEGELARRTRREQQLMRSDRRLAQAVEIMQAHMEEPLTVEEICTRIGLSVWQLRRLFQRELRQSPSSYYMELRMRRARELLEHGRAQIQEIALACGFADAPSFNTAFRRHYDMTPSVCRRHSR